MSNNLNNPRKYGHPNFYKYLEEMGETHSRKNHDYASQDDPLSNFDDVADACRIRCDKCGHIQKLKPWEVVIMFLMTKIVRIQQLFNKANLVKGEGITDSCMDGSVYFLLERLILEKYKKAGSQ